MLSAIMKMLGDMTLSFVGFVDFSVLYCLFSVVGGVNEGAGHIAVIG
jgi:hypothetical protein